MKNPTKTGPLWRARGGFTLLEIMVVVIIIGVLATLVIINVSSSRDTAFRKTAQTAVKGSFVTALELYYIESNMYPSTEQGLHALVTMPTSAPVPTKWKSQLNEVPLDPWDHPYQYRLPGTHNPSKFDVFSMGPDGLPDTPDDLGNWPPPVAQQTY